MKYSDFFKGLAPYINEQNDLIDFTKFHTKDEKVKLIDCPPSVRNRLITYYVKFIGYEYFNGELYIKVRHSCDCSIGPTWNIPSRSSRYYQYR